MKEKKAPTPNNPKPNNALSTSSTNSSTLNENSNQLSKSDSSDVEELEHQLNEIENALNNLESQNDTIHSKLKDLLESNREIRKEMIQMGLINAGPQDNMPPSTESQLHRLHAMNLGGSVAPVTTPNKQASPKPKERNISVNSTNGISIEVSNSNNNNNKPQASSPKKQPPPPQQQQQKQDRAVDDAGGSYAAQLKKRDSTKNVNKAAF